MVKFNFERLYENVNKNPHHLASIFGTKMMTKRGDFFSELNKLFSTDLY